MGHLLKEKTMETNIKLMVVFSKLNNAFANSLGTNLKELNLPASMYPILAHLNKVEKEKTQKLGEIAVITSGTITHIVKKLEKLNYVTKAKDENDKRITWVKITSKGKSEFLKVHKQHMLYLNNLLSEFNENEKQEFIDQMKYFGKTIEKRNG